MPHSSTRTKEQDILNNIELSLTNYKNLFNKGLSLIETEPDPRQLLHSILEEYQTRLEQMPAIDLSHGGIEKLSPELQEQVKSLVLFGTQAVLINDNAKIQRNLRIVNENYKDLLSVVTHEFKNSLTSIYGYNRLIRKQLSLGNTAQIEEISTNIDRLTKTLFGLVETLFSMSLIEQGALSLDSRLFDVYQDAILPVLHELELALQSQGMSVHVEGSGEKKIYYGDDRLMQIVFRNLIQNATQYGLVNTSIQIKISSNKDELKIEVFNLGNGVRKEDLGQIFDKFSRFHNGHNKTNVGIGLFAVKKIIELHQGEITAESEFGKWIRFIISLPILK